MNKKYLLPAIVVLFVMMLVVVFYVLAGQTTAPASDVKPGQTEVLGKVTCLPHKGTGPQTLECAYGIQDDGGRYYGVRNDGMAITKYSMGTWVLVTGALSKPAADDKYDIVGNIDASSVKEARATCVPSKNGEQQCAQETP